MGNELAGGRPNPLVKRECAWIRTTDLPRGLTRLDTGNSQLEAKLRFVLDQVQPADTIAPPAKRAASHLSRSTGSSPLLKRRGHLHVPHGVTFASEGVVHDSIVEPCRSLEDDRTGEAA